MNRVQANAATHRGLDWSFVARGVFHGLVAIVVVKAGIERLQLIWPHFGLDARIYRTATLAWLSGADPWTAGAAGERFNAPPPSLLPMIPSALLPEHLAVAFMFVLTAAAGVWLVSRLRLPWYWLAFTPLLEGIWAGNPNVIVVALLVAGVGWLAALFKIYAIVPLVIWRDWRRLRIAALVLLVTALLLPWGTFLGQYQSIAASLASQSAGGRAATGWLIVPTAIALLSLPRREAGWLFVPALWPMTQYHYATFMMPVGHPIFAVLMISNEPGLPAVAVILYATWISCRRALTRRSGWPGLRRGPARGHSTNDQDLGRTGESSGDPSPRADADDRNQTEP